MSYPLKLTYDEQIEAQKIAMELQGEMYNRYAIEGFLKKYKNKKKQIYEFWKRGSAMMQSAYRNCFLYENKREPNLLDYIFLMFFGFFCAIGLYLFLCAFCFALGGY